ncbi:MAG: hemin receptor [Prevotella sp.]|nr:hemin receptor [Prevotella sp.]
MKKKVLAAFALAVALPMAAQDTYESARLLGSDLNGTARYVGMGGAMDALGADISTISTNPAGIGLFRHSAVSASMGIVSQQDVQKFDGLGKTNLSFDQLGFVYSMRIDRNSFINFGFNYHKSRNFDQILSVADHAVKDASSNLLTAEKENQGFYTMDYNRNNELVGYRNNREAHNFSQLDWLNANILSDEVPGDKDNIDLVLNPIAADTYNFDRAHRGWISDFDFNVSGNSNDRFYWGFTAGFKSVNYKGRSGYAEGLAFLSGDDAGYLTYADERKITGTGLDLKAGIIFRPIEASPFRIGLSVATPTWYNLKSSNYTEVDNKSAMGETIDGGYTSGGNIENTYEFKYYTPWKFGISLGHTIGTNIAIGAGYEYSNYSASQNRVNDGYDYYNSSYIDENMKRNTELSLKGVSTLKVGAEIKPVPEVAIRLGYNYQTAAYDEKGVRDQTIDSYGTYYASTSDYVNWEGTNRITCGLGFKVDKMNIDLAYQYSATNGKFYPFQPDLAGTVKAADVNNKRHQVLLTLGYTF